MRYPETTINICAGVMLDNRYIHSIRFKSQAYQLAYFAGKVVKSFSGYSYCRKSWNIQVHAKLEEAYGWNYLYFQNEPGGKHWFYFINQIEYINENTVELSLELDVIQTYQLEWRLGECFIERQHNEMDWFGCNTVEENLDTGELSTTYANATTDIEDLEELAIVILSTFDPATADGKNDIKFKGGLINGIFTGLMVSVVEKNDWDVLAERLYDFSNYGTIDGIVSMFMYPKKLISLGQYPVDGKQASWTDTSTIRPVASFIPYHITHTISPTVFNHVRGYHCKNKKTLQYPYNFLYVSNNQGGGGIFRYERMHKPISQNGMEMTLTLYGSCSPDSTVKLVIEGYDDMGHETAVTLGGYPTCAWNADAYKIWLAQNQNSLNLSTALNGLSIVGGAVTTAVGVATANPALALMGGGSMVSGAKGIADTLASVKDREVQPPQARGAHSASTNIASKKQTFTLIQKCVTTEQAQIIDNYFTMFGYAQRVVAVPNLDARPHFTYIKTLGCTVTGFMCNEDRVKIESIFDKGITFWTNGDKIADYSQENPPKEDPNANS